MKLKALLLGVAVALLFPTAGWSGPKGRTMKRPTAASAQNSAEAQRLRDEMEKLAKKNAWPGVERTYQKLIALKGITPTGDDHYHGAQAARATGDVAAVLDRLKKAKAAGHANVADWIGDIERNYGQVQIKKQKKSNRELKPAAMPFAPDQRSAIEFAAARIAKKGKFEGWLPKGDYTLGDQKFTVKPGGGKQIVKRK